MCARKLDRTGRITRLYEKALRAAWDEERDEYALWEAWFNSNYDLLHTKRLLASTDPVYLMAGELKMFSNVPELLKTSFLVHQVSWSGEKEAIRYLRSAEASQLDLLELRASGSLLALERSQTGDALHENQQDIIGYLFC